MVELPKSLHYRRVYALTDLSYDTVLELVKQRKLKSRLVDGELYVNSASLVSYLRSLPEDYHCVEVFTRNHGGL